MIQRALQSLLRYGIGASLVDPANVAYTVNRLLDVLGLDDYDENAEPLPEAGLEGILGEILNHARSRGLAAEGTAAGDLFDTRVMGCLTPPPNEIAEKFWRLHATSPAEATTWFYTFSQDTDYIRRYRIARDIHWKVPSEYGEIELSINLAKPEKDPREIAAAANATTGYPKCQLCLENEGYAGRPGHPARQNHRIIPIRIAGQRWGFQYSPYVYYNEHCIAMNGRHVPMHVDRAAFEGLFGFLELFPHYFIGSNADLPIVGGSILSHDHYQGGRHDFAMARAAVKNMFRVAGFPGVECGVVQWPLSVIRLRGPDPEEITALAVHILEKWRGYTDEKAMILAKTGDTPHNTITPIARKNGAAYELDLALRNNLTTAEHPMGLYHPHAEYHHIKSENIGLIEVMGLAILPARLKAELDETARMLQAGEDLRSNPATAKHADWAESIVKKEQPSDSNSLRETLLHETGMVFVKVLECCAVFKRTPDGTQAFSRFIASL